MGGREEEEPRLRSDPEPTVELPIEDALDLHTFHPRDLRVVVEEYLFQCSKRGFREVRIIHGRGKGVQRAAVRSLLGRNPWVTGYRDAAPECGGWGATIVHLKSNVD